MHVVHNFGQSLWFGSTHIYQSLPRMLTLWLDYGAEVAASSGQGRSESSLKLARSLLSLINQYKQLIIY